METINNKQQNALNQLVASIESSGYRVATVDKADLVDGLIYFIVSSNFKIAPHYTGNKSVIGFIGKRGKLTITHKD